MTPMRERIILASASPTRAQLLKAAGLTPVRFVRYKVGELS